MSGLAQKEDRLSVLVTGKMTWKVNLEYICKNSLPLFLWETDSMQPCFYHIALEFSHSSSRQFYFSSYLNSNHWVAEDYNQRRHHLTLTHFTEIESFPQDNNLSPQPSKYFYRHLTEITVMGGARDGINVIKSIIYMNPKVRSYFQTVFQNLSSVPVFTGNFNGIVLISVELYPFTRTANLIHPFIPSAFFSLEGKAITSSDSWKMSLENWDWVAFPISHWCWLGAEQPGECGKFPAVTTFRHKRAGLLNGPNARVTNCGFIICTLQWELLAHPNAHFDSIV